MRKLYLNHYEDMWKECVRASGVLKWRCSECRKNQWNFKIELMYDVRILNHVHYLNTALIFFLHVCDNEVLKYIIVLNTIYYMKM